MAFVTDRTAGVCHVQSHGTCPSNLCWLGSPRRRHLGRDGEPHPGGHRIVKLRSRVVSLTLPFRKLNKGTMSFVHGRLSKGRSAYGAVV